MRKIVVIPARMASTRFPGKPLCDLAGKPMVQWVYEAALASQVGDRAYIATPDLEIFEAAEQFGAAAIMTRSDHPSGTDRIAEVAEQIEADVYINVQGDEPLIVPETIIACASAFDDREVQMSSVWTRCREEDVESPTVVKVVLDKVGNALYFSRYPIPFPRNHRSEPVKQHVGIYGYRRDTLARFKTWCQTPLELAESLEQLRFLENGVRIRMCEGTAAMGVDTPEQAEEVRRLLLSKQ